jgi:FADH2 O2-dependent halogenase
VLSESFDIAIVGSGFGGSLLAMIARRLGHSVVLLEKGKHPRFAIGESSTPLANLMLEELATRYDLPRLLPLTKWGTWQQTYPEVAVGLKRGFTFYHHTRGCPWTSDAARRNQLLVAASPHDTIADTHWYRADFDHFFVREAQSLGVDYRDEVSLAEPQIGAEGALLIGEQRGEPLSIHAKFLVDATGPRGFLHRALRLPEQNFEHLPATQALFSHFTGVHRLDDLVFGNETPPYPVDNAAVHHIFDGGWIWVLRFNNGITSAGVAATDEVAQELRFEEGEPAWHRLLQRLPTVQAQFASATPQLPFIHARRLPFRSGVVAGQWWALLPSAAGFVDPLLSTGFVLTLLGVARLAEAIEQHWEQSSFAERLNDYAAITMEDLSAAERLVAALYTHMNDFPVFSALTLLYFAAASYSETARRLGRPELAGSFLMHSHPQFGPALRQCCERAMHAVTPQQKQELLQHIRQVIEPFDVAGLSDSTRRNWYPVLAADLVHAGDKVGATTEEINHLLARCGF